MKKVSVSNGKYWAMVDDEDFDEVSKLTWYFDRGRNETMYAKATNRHKGVPVVPGFPSTIQMHRLILDLKKGNYVDHVDHDGMNNQKNNLRIVSNKQNCLNRNKQVGDYTSNYRGVCFNANHKKWHAYINIQDKIDGKIQINLGCYADEKTAALVYDGAMREKYGDDFLNPNFPDFEGEYPKPNIRGKVKGYYFDPKQKLFFVEFRKDNQRFRGCAKTEAEAIAKRKEFEQKGENKMTELVVLLRDEDRPGEVERLIGASLKRKSKHSPVYTCEVDDDVLEKTIGTLDSSPLVKSVEKNNKSFSILNK